MQPLEFTGKYASCRVFTEVIEEAAVQQIYDFLNCPASEGMTLRFMPDIHAGAGCVIGFTGTLTDKIIPNLIGVDIGCGVASMKVYDPEWGTEKPDLDFLCFDNIIRETVPSGFNVRDKALPYEAKDEVTRVAVETGQDPERVHKSMGTLGGGNHFIELGQDQYGGLWLTIHSGSRNFGLKIAKFHQAKAIPTVGKGKGLEWLEGEAAQLYCNHMIVAQDFAKQNRAAMLNLLSKFFWTKGLLKNGPADAFKDPIIVESVHNYINFEDRIIRKGAISAHHGELVIIPWNMRDGMIIGEGRGNLEWNCSAPHGAGRVCGRKEAKRKFKVEDFHKSMEGIWTSCVGQDTLDEAPFVYKDHEVIRAAIADTVNIMFTIKPIYNFKASE